MSGSVRVFQPVAGEADELEAAFVEDPHHWLPTARRDGAHSWRVTVHAGAFTREVALAIGAPWRSGASVWRTIQWDPTAEDSQPSTIERLLPSFDGELGIHLSSQKMQTLMVDGRYTPPGGTLGAAMDAMALNRLAHATVKRLVADIAAGLTAAALLQIDSDRT